LIGAHFAEIREMYLTVSAALGNQRHARAIAFGHAPVPGVFNIAQRTAVVGAFEIAGLRRSVAHRANDE
jgi:hypothetical protein